MSFYELSCSEIIVPIRTISDSLPCAHSWKNFRVAPKKQIFFGRTPPHTYSTFRKLLVTFRRKNCSLRPKTHIFGRLGIPDPPIIKKLFLKNTCVCWVVPFLHVQVSNSVLCYFLLISLGGASKKADILQSG